MKLLICDCGGHEFVVFTGTWLPIAPKEMASRLMGACISCGKDWDLETAMWIDNAEALEEAEKEHIK